MKDQRVLSSPLSKKPKRKLEMVLLICSDHYIGRIGSLPGMGFHPEAVGNPAGRPDEIPVQITPAVSKPLTYSIKVTGDILPLMQVDLFPKVSGYLERIDVHIGDIVKQGQVIAQIDRTDYLHKVREIEAKVAQVKAQLIGARNRDEDRGAASGRGSGPAGPIPIRKRQAPA